MRVLLIGTHKLLAKALKQGLEEEGFTVDVPHHGDNESDKVPAAGYDAIVLDLLRPGPAGLSGLQRWRRAGLLLPVLVLSAPPGIHDLAPGLDSGVDDWLTKPFALEELFDRVRALVSRHEMRRDCGRGIQAYDGARRGAGGSIKLP
jgi:DNA-binding response OmpR family regulator